MKKRGQITVFIILGIILLLSIGLVVYFTKQQVVKPIQKMPFVPEDVKPVYDYVVGCIEEISRDGLVILGLQGGYINVPVSIQRTPDSYVASDPFGAVKTPLWFYEGEDRTPPLSFIERELSAYIRKRLPECTGDFEAFAGQFDVVASDEIIPLVSFTSEHVLLDVVWSLKIKHFDRITDLNRFASYHNVRFKQMWELADKVMKAENKEQWFENVTLDLMSMNSNIPFDGMELKCGASKWELSNVKDELKSMLAFFLPKVRIVNTVTPPTQNPARDYERLKRQSSDITNALMAGKEPKWPESTPDDLWEVNRLSWDIGIPKSDLKTAFLYYPYWNVKLLGKPNDGGVLSSSLVKGSKKFLSFFCINQWHFIYDVIFPVKMSVKDDDAFNGEGYFFNMAFPVVIQNNQPSRSVFGYRLFVAPDFGSEYCEKLGDQVFDVRAMGFSEFSPFAEELDNADVVFTCLSKECYLGNTISDETGIVRLTGYLPQGCSNPLLYVKKDGYLFGRDYYHSGPMEIFMTKLQKMKVSFEFYPYQSTTKSWLDQVFYGSLKDLPKDYSVSVSLYLKDFDYSQVKEFSSETAGFADDDAGVLEFAFDSVVYDLSVILLKKNLVVGGFNLKNFSVDFTDIFGREEVVFKVVEWTPLPLKDEDQSALAHFIYGDGLFDGVPYNVALRPVFK